MDRTKSGGSRTSLTSGSPSATNRNPSVTGVAVDTQNDEPAQMSGAHLLISSELAEIMGTLERRAKKKRPAPKPPNMQQQHAIGIGGGLTRDEEDQAGSAHQRQGDIQSAVRTGPQAAPRKTQNEPTSHPSIGPLPAARVKSLPGSQVELQMGLQELESEVTGQRKALPGERLDGRGGELRGRTELVVGVGEKSSKRAPRAAPRSKPDTKLDDRGQSGYWTGSQSELHSASSSQEEIPSKRRQLMGSVDSLLEPKNRQKPDTDRSKDVIEISKHLIRQKRTERSDENTTRTEHITVPKRENQQPASGSNQQPVSGSNQQLVSGSKAQHSGEGINPQLEVFPIPRTGKTKGKAPVAPRLPSSSISSQSQDFHTHQKGAEKLATARSEAPQIEQSPSGDENHPDNDQKIQVSDKIATMTKAQQMENSKISQYLATSDTAKEYDAKTQAGKQVSNPSGSPQNVPSVQTVPVKDVQIEHSAITMATELDDASDTSVAEDFTGGEEIDFDETEVTFVEPEAGRSQPVQSKAALKAKEHEQVVSQTRGVQSSSQKESEIQLGTTCVKERPRKKKKVPTATLP